MPIYEYRCAACGHQQEFLQRLNEAPHTKCPKCSKKSLKKMVTAAGFQLKGTGWYATDFKNSGAKPAADKGKSKEQSAPAKDAPAKEAPAKDKSKSDSKSSAGAAVNN